MTHTMSATSTLRVHPTRSVRRTSGLVLVGKTEVEHLAGFGSRLLGSGHLI